MKLNRKYLLVFVIMCMVVNAMETYGQETNHIAPAPLFRDPITDGVADPTLIYNREEKAWWMLYTQRRANTDAADVAYCYGTAIAIASTSDEGKTWVYRGTLDLEFKKGKNTFWAPDVVYHDGRYHMYVAYIEGVRNHWGGQAKMAHYVSTNLWDWEFQDFPVLTSEKVIDASLFKDSTGLWRMWYKDESNPEGNMLMAESNDLKTWKTNQQPIFPGKGQEGPKVFEYKGYYWLLTDEWAGMRIYRSKDLQRWEKQGRILDTKGKRPDDTPTGAHGDVIVVNDKAYIFYFTHPGREEHRKADNNAIGVLPYEMRRSSAQVAELKFENETLTAVRDEPFDFVLSAPIY